MAVLQLIYADWPTRPFGTKAQQLCEAVREAGLSGQLRAAGHDVHELSVRARGDDAAGLAGGLRLAGEVAADIRRAAAAGHLSIVVSGSCSVADIAAAAALGPDGLGILWCDAHPDLNTPETSQSGNVDGMALALALGLGWSDDIAAHLSHKPPIDPAVCFFGVRSIEEAERQVMEKHALPVMAQHRDALAQVAAARNLYIHLDMDVHDAIQVRASHGPVPGGKTVRDIQDILAGAARAGALRSIGITGLDPSAPQAPKALQIIIDHSVAIAYAWELAHA